MRVRALDLSSVSGKIKSNKKWENVKTWSYMIHAEWVIIFKTKKTINNPSNNNKSTLSFY